LTTLTETAELLGKQPLMATLIVVNRYYVPDECRRARSRIIFHFSFHIFHFSLNPLLLGGAPLQRSLQMENEKWKMKNHQVAIARGSVASGSATI
jgi:hypothetical protein